MTISSFAQATKRFAILAGVLGTSTMMGTAAIAQEYSEPTSDPTAPSAQPGQMQMPEQDAQEAPGQMQMPDQNVQEVPGEVPGQETQMPTSQPDTSAMSIVEVASGNESFNTLTQAIQAAGLTDTLSGQGPYTVFAPTDEAFSQLPEGTLDFLLQPENRDLLQQVLSYHVVQGEIPSSEISTGPVEALGGGLAVRVAEDRVIVNNASVVQPDVQASNGVIHAVNRVLLPESLQRTLATRLGVQEIY